MQDWRDEGVVLMRRPHGESAAVVEVFTRDHGRHAGLVHGGGGRRLAAVLQPGSQVQVTWRARLEAQLGTFTVEPVRSRAHLMEDRLALAGMSAICALLLDSLPERAPHPGLWSGSVALLDRLSAPDWQGDYLRWELALLQEMGFGLDLSRCAVTGARQGLAFVSPKTGRAVTWEGAGEWADRLLPLPAALVAGSALKGEDLRQGLAITGHFLARELAVLHPARAGRPLPDARGRLMDLMSR